MLMNGGVDTRSEGQIHRQHVVGGPRSPIQTRESTAWDVCRSPAPPPPSYRPAHVPNLAHSRPGAPPPWAWAVCSARRTPPGHRVQHAAPRQGLCMDETLRNQRCGEGAGPSPVCKGAQTCPARACNTKCARGPKVTGSPSTDGPSHQAKPSKPGDGTCGGALHSSALEGTPARYLPQPPTPQTKSVQALYPVSFRPAAHRRAGPNANQHRGATPRGARAPAGPQNPAADAQGDAEGGGWPPAALPACAPAAAQGDAAPDRTRDACLDSPAHSPRLGTS